MTQYVPEQTLRDAGIEPTVVSSLDALAGAVPLPHSPCTVIKLHGDYLDTRIKNTAEELAGYGPEFDRLLARIFDEHGLIVCGWSAEWDPALRSAIMRIQSRRYSTFWATRSSPAARAAEVISHRGAKIIPINSADDFFTKLAERVSLLDSVTTSNPKTIRLLLATTKKYLAKPEHRIQLFDLLREEYQAVARQIVDVGFKTDGVPWSIEEFQTRVARYEAVCERIVRLVGVAGRWGDGTEFEVVCDILRQLHSVPAAGGVDVYLDLRRYPVMLTAYGFGLAALRAGRLAEVHDLLTLQLPQGEAQPAPFVQILFLQSWRGVSYDKWQTLPDLKNRTRPLSEHLFGLFAKWMTDYTIAPAESETIFDQFELFGSLAYSSLKYTPEVLADRAKTGTASFVPTGHLSWKGTAKARLLKEFQEEPLLAKILAAGFFRKSERHLKLSCDNFATFCAQESY